MSAQVAADLRAAADVLERDGWTQARMHSPEGCHCIAGSLEVVVDPDWQRGDGWDTEQNRRFSRAMDVLWQAVETSGAESVVHWNDTQHRTAAEVIAALRAAADRAEAES